MSQNVINGLTFIIYLCVTLVSVFETLCLSLYFLSYVDLEALYLD